MTYVSVPRLFCNHDQFTNTQLNLTPDDRAHLAALRVRAGEKIDLVTDRAEVWHVTITAIQSHTLTFETNTISPIPSPHLPKITLIQALPKGDKFSEIIQNCGQLDITEFRAWQSIRSISIPKQNQWNHKINRWQTIAKNTAAQSKQYRIPQIYPHIEHHIHQMTCHSDLKIVLWEEEFGTSLKSILSHQHHCPASITLVIGPEGGITPEEMAQFRDIGFQSASLGNSILRVELAAFSAVSNIRLWFDC